MSFDADGVQQQQQQQQPINIVVCVDAPIFEKADCGDSETHSQAVLTHCGEAIS